MQARWVPKRALGCACTPDTKTLDTNVLSDHHQSTFWCGFGTKNALVSRPWDPASRLSLVVGSTREAWHA
jgi:hypothetical protein